MKLLSLQKLLQEAQIVLQRFPMVLFSALIGTVAFWVIIENPDNNVIYTKLLMCAALGIALFFSITLFSEREEWNLNRKVIGYVTGLAFLIIYYIYLPAHEKDFSVDEVIRYILWFIGIHLVVSFILFLRKGQITSFWQFNEILFIRILISILYSGFLYAGISIAILAIDQLFEVKIEPEVYGRLWGFIVGIFNTWFFLSGIPQDFNELEELDFYPIGLKIFTQYVLLPLVTLYLLILYVYSGKILIEWELPKGWVTYLVLAFSIAGIFSLLLIHPIRNQEENRWIKTFSKGFYFAILPLILLLFIAIGRRISDYGMTENRYFVIVLACWLLAIAIYFLISKVKNIKYIPISLAVIVLFSSFGPWGAIAVGRNSQIRRLVSILETNNLMKDGKVQKLKKGKELTEEEQNSISSILDYLSDRGKLTALSPYFEDNLDSLLEEELSSYDKKQLVAGLIGDTDLADKNYRDYQTESSTYFSFSTSQNEQDFLDIRGYDTYLKAHITLNDTTYYGDTANFQLMLVPDKHKLILLKDSVAILDFPLENMLNTLIKEYPDEDSLRYTIPLSEMTIQSENRKYKAILKIFQMNGERIKKSKNQLNEVVGVLLFQKIKEEKE